MDKRNQTEDKVLKRAAKCFADELLRYFNVSQAKFGVLTNGITYRFYTDLAEPNKMDEKPFLEVNLLDLKDAQIEELCRIWDSGQWDNFYYSIFMELPPRTVIEKRTLDSEVRKRSR